MSDKTTYHSTFTLERTYSAPPSRVFAAFADPEKKAMWFQPPPGWEAYGHTMDFRVGGTEHNRVGPKGAETHIFEARYFDIVPDERIVFTYEMYLDEMKMSVSLTTIELEAVESGTHIYFTEQGVFLNDPNDAAQREQGTNFLLDAVGRSLEG